MGHVVWCGTPGGRDDAALVEIDDPSWKPVDDDPVWAIDSAVRWGTTVTHLPELPCESWGVPDVMQRAGQPAVDTGQLKGVINLGSRMASDQYLVRLNGHPPATGKDGRSPWGGMSGAAVCIRIRELPGSTRNAVGELLIAVIMADDPSFAHSALPAVPAYVLHHDPEFRAVLATHVRTTVLEPVELAALATPEDGPDPHNGAVSPAELLTERRSVVGFRGRAELLKELRTWAEQPGVGVWLIHGPAGQGKTRLARHFSEQIAVQGWSTLWLKPDADDLAVITDMVWPTLVVVDYAESRPGQLAALLGMLAPGGRSSLVKVLALARTVGEWWEEVADTSDAVATLLDTATVTPLPVLDATDNARRDGYRAAVAAFAAELTRLPGNPAIDWSTRAAALTDRPLSATTGSTVLAIQMTALADLLDTTEPSEPEDHLPEVTTSGRDVGDSNSPQERVLRHERRYWLRTARAAGIHPALGRLTLTDTVAATVLLMPPIPEQANDWLMRIPGLADETYDRRDRVREWLAGLYPAAGPHAFGQLEPDLLAEHLIGTEIAKPARTSIAETLATHINGHDATRWVSVCARAAAHPGLGDPVGEMLTRMCKQYPTTVAVAALDVAPGLEEPKPLVHALECFVHDPAVPTADLTSVADAVPTSSWLWAKTKVELLGVLTARSKPEKPDEDEVQGRRQFDPLGADRIQFGNEITWITTKAAESQGLRIEWTRSDLASNLAELAQSLADSGRREEALAASTQAIEMFRRLAQGTGSHRSPSRGQDTTDALPSSLAASLANHSNMLAALGRHEDALAAITEAMQIFDELAKTRPEAHLRNVAGCLNNRSATLARSGQRMGALSDNSRAIEMFRQLVGSGNDAVFPDLAVSLASRSYMLAELGHHEDALNAMSEAVQICERLASTDPGAHLLQLAKYQHDLAYSQANIGRPEGALATSTQAVKTFRRLAKARPDAFRANLARELHDLAIRSAICGRWTDALAENTEAVQIYRKLSDADPDAFLPDLAKSLSTRANVLDTEGRRQDALAAGTEAVQIYQQLAAAHPDAFHPRLASSLHRLALIEEKIGRSSLALANIERAIVIFEELAERNRVTYTPDLADSVKNQATWLSKSGRRSQALPAAKRAVALYEELTEDNPSAHLPDLAVSVDNLAILLSEMGRHREAIHAFERTVAVCEKLAEADRDTHLLPLAVSADRLAIQLGGLGRYPEAVVAAERAVTLREELAGVDRAAYLPALAASVNNIALWLGEVGRYPEALAAGRRVVGFYEELAETDRASYLPELATAVRGLAADLVAADLRDEAVAAAQRAVTCYEELAAADRFIYQPELARSVDKLAANLADTGRRTDAMAASERTVVLLEELVAADRASHLPALARAYWTAVYVRLPPGTDRVAALTLCDKAIRLYRELADTDPDAFHQSLSAVEALRRKLSS
ncbi:tetratricopeptide repeat protein [Nocardia alni]|uniref:tetratricopeptide repeat protein n=1 Tax=Nocardia alni TaxID=2815723 RepID=UPI001C22561F|nr:tetratricopeptide repeat protein [Nocardia alni]